MPSEQSGQSVTQTTTPWNTNRRPAVTPDMALQRTPNSAVLRHQCVVILAAFAFFFPFQPAVGGAPHQSAVPDQSANRGKAVQPEPAGSEEAVPVAVNYIPTGSPRTITIAGTFNG